MDLKVWMYLIYLAVSVGLTIWVARALSRNGLVFLEEVFAEKRLAQAVNQPPGGRLLPAQPRLRHGGDEALRPGRYRPARPWRSCLSRSAWCCWSSARCTSSTSSRSAATAETDSASSPPTPARPDRPTPHAVRPSRIAVGRRVPGRTTAVPARTRPDPADRSAAGRSAAGRRPDEQPTNPMTVPPTGGVGRLPDPTAHSGGGIRVFTVLFDAACPLCRAARRWLSSRAQLVPLEFVPAGSAEARRRFPGLDHDATLRDLTVIADTGEVYAGDGAWFACLWALADHRSTGRAARPAAPAAPRPADGGRRLGDPRNGSATRGPSRSTKPAGYGEPR